MPAEKQSELINKIFEGSEDVLKVEASQKLRESPDHDPNHRYVDKSFGSFHKPFIIFAQAPTPVEPSKCSLNHPPFW